MPLHPGKSKEIVSKNISEMEASGHPHDQAVAAALHNAHPDGGKNMADGGMPEPQETDTQGLKDATVPDFLAPYLLGPALSKMGEAAAPALKALGEEGAIFPKKAPIMEEAAEAGAPKIEAFIKGVQKGPSGDVKIWGVKGPPELLKAEFGDEAPGSVPEHILRSKGILPEQVSMPTEKAPNDYAKGGFVDLLDKIKSNKTDAEKADAVDPAVDTSSDTAKAPPAKVDSMSEGGKVERSSLEHPVPNAMMARAMDKGGVWLQNMPAEQVDKATHVEGKKSTEDSTSMTGTKNGYGTKNMADGGVMPHEEKMREIYKAMGIKKYADGGVAPSDGAVDVSQLPGGGMPAPSPSDPTYWDQIKAALSKLSSSPAATIAGAAMSPLDAAADAVKSVAPAIMRAEAPAVSGVANAMSSGAIPAVQASPAPSMPIQSPIAPSTAPASAQAAAPGIQMPTSPGGVSAAGMPNIGSLFNQDTSKLTAGVNPEDRQALANKLQEQQHGIGAVIAQAVAGLGDALAAKGGKDQHSLQNIFSMEKAQRDEALANFDKARQDRLQKLALQTQMGDNALKQAAAADTYGVDEHLNGLIGAPKGTMKKDLPTYFSIMSAQIAQKEKDADLYMKSHAQAASDVDNAVKNASVLSIKPSSAQLQASGAKLADTYYNRAKGNILVKPSDGGPAQWIPAQNLGKAKQIDPNLTVQQ